MNRVSKLGGMVVLAVVLGGGSLAHGRVLGGAPRTLALGPGSIVVLDDGGASSGAAAVIDVNPATGAQTVLAEFGRATGFDVAPNGDLLVADYGTDQILRVDRQTQASSRVAAGDPLRNPTHMVLGADGDLFVIDEGDAVDTPGDDAIVRVDPGTGVATVLPTTSDFGVLRGIAAAPDGTLFVLDLGAAVAFGGDERILRVDPVSGAQSVVVQGAPLAVPNDLFVRDGMLVVADGDALSNTRGPDVRNGAILAVDLQSATATYLSRSPEYLNPRSVAAVPGSSDLWVLDAGDGAQTGDEYLFRVDGTTHVVTSTLSQNDQFVQPWQVKVLGTPTCGNGTVDFGEQCDDGADNGSSSSCCTPQCVVASNGAPCADVRQVFENGVPQPIVNIRCRLPVGVTKGKCRAKLIATFTSATIATGPAAAAKKPKRVAISKAKTLKLKNGRRDGLLQLSLTNKGKQLLNVSPDGTLSGEALGIVGGKGGRTKIRNPVLLRR